VLPLISARITLSRLTLGALLALLISLAALTQADPDLWGHVRFGIDMIRTHALPQIDPYSFTQDRPWINHEWLSEALMGAAWQTGGTAGLALLKACLGVLTLYVVWRAYRDAEITWQIVATGIAVVVSAQILQTFRPQVWSIVAIALLAAHLQSPAALRPWWYFFLFCGWANLHGGWVVGIGVLAAWGAMSGTTSRVAARKWTIVVASAMAGTLVTPYGWRLWMFMAQTVRLTRPQIEDWAPLWASSPAKWILWALIAAWSVWAWGKQRHHRLETGLVLIGLGAASIKVVRLVPLFGVVSLILLAPGLTAWRPRRALTPLQPREARAAALIAIVICVSGSIWVGRSSLSCISRDDRMPDPLIVRTLAHAPPGRMVTFFNWGEYAIWHLGPAIRVSMDGRRETVYSDARIREHDAILFGRPDGLRTLASWRPDYVWLPNSSQVTRQWLTGNGYRLQIQTADSFVAVPADAPPLTYAPAPSQPPPCFPD
jgi:hypothetical protein